MTLKDQIKGNEWKVVAAVTAAGVIGVGGIAVAGPPNQSQGEINLKDRTELTSLTVTTDASDFTFPTVMDSVSADTGLQSPFSPVSPDTQDSPVSADTSSPDSPISPDTSSPDSPISPDTSSPDSPISPHTSSPDSPISPDSPASPLSEDTASSFDT